MPILRPGPGVAISEVSSLQAANNAHVLHPIFLDQEFKRFKSRVYHECLEVMLGVPLAEDHANGGFWLSLSEDESPKLFFPCVSNIIQDMPEVIN